MATDNLDKLNPNPLVSTQDNPFLEAARQSAGTTQDGLKQSFQVVAGKDPDHIAQVQRMANTLRIDTGFVERHFDDLQKKLEPERVDYEKLASENPGVSRFLENSDNAAIAKDDLNAISAVEKPIKGYYASNTSRPFYEYGFDVYGAANRGSTNLSIGALHTLAAYGKIDPVTATGYAKELYAKQRRLEEEKPQYLADLSSKLEQEAGDVESAGKQFWRGWDDRARGKTAQGLKDMYFGASIGLYEVLDRAAEYPLNPRATTNLLVENLAQMVPTLLTSAGGAAAGAAAGFAVAGPPGAIVGGAVGQGAGNFIGEVPIELGSSISDDFQKLGIDTNDDQQLLAFFSNAKLQKEIRERGLRKGLGTAGVDSLAAMFAGHFSSKARGLGLGARTVAAAKDVAVGAAGDLLSEGVGQAAREKNFRDVSFNDMMDEVFLGLMHNAAETGVSISTRRSIEAAQKIRESFSKDPVRAGQEAATKGNEAKATLAEIKDVNDAIDKLGQTKLLDRSPEAAKTMIEHIKDSTDGEDDSGSSYFQTSDWDKFWTDNKVDPRDAASLLLNDDGKAYDEAKQTGATFSVDTADLMIGLSLVAKQSAISGDVSLKDIAGNVLKIMRTKPDGMSAIEAAEYLRDAPEVMKQLGGEIVASEKQAAKAAALPSGEVAQDQNQIPLPIATREEQVNQIRQNITQQLIDTGMNQKEARVQAQLYEGGIRSLSERSGMSPEEIFKRFGPKIQRVEEINIGEGKGYSQSAGALDIPKFVPIDPPSYNWSEVPILIKQIKEMNPEEVVNLLRPTIEKDGEVLISEVIDGYDYQKLGEESIYSFMISEGDISDISPEELKSEFLNFLSGVSNDENLKRSVIESETKKKNNSNRIRFEVDSLSKILKDNGFLVSEKESGLSDSVYLDIYKDENDAKPTTVRVSDHSLPISHQQTYGISDIEINTSGVSGEANAADYIDALKIIQEKYGVKILNGDRGKSFNQSIDEKNAIGRFIVGQDGKTKIQLTPNSNKSTFLHETGHFFLEIFGTLVEEGVGDAQFKQDYQTILDWFGVKSKDDIKVEHHEQFARGFERYLGEGLAPSSALQRAFNNFKIWLVDLYKNLVNLNTPLTNEVREVMDRLLATDEEIQKAKGDINFEPIFEDPKIYGFSDTDAAIYANALADAESFAKQALDQKLFQEVRAERKRQVRDEAKRMEKVIESQLNQRQEIIIQSIVGDGVMPDGSPLPNEVPAVKITRESVKRLFGEDAIKGMKQRYFSKEGSDIEFAAALLGLEGPKDLFNILKFGKNKEDLVKQLSNLAAYQKFPSLLFSPELSQSAKDAYYNENRSKFLEHEVKFLRDDRVAAYKNVVKKLISKPLNAPEAKARAARILANKSLSELRPRIYQLAESKASREAAQLFNANDIDGAIMAKERQLLNHELYRAAVEAQSEIKKAEVKFKEIFKDSEDLAKTREMNYVSAARAILAKFELGPEQDLEPIQYLDKIKEYDTDAYNDMVSLTNSVLMDIKPANELTYDNFLNLRDNVLAMWDLAKDHKEIETAKGKMLVEDAIDALSETMEKPGINSDLGMTPGDFEGIKQEILSIRAAGTRVEAFVDYMDRGGLGIWNRTIWQPVKEATAKWREMKTQSRKKFLNIFKEYGGIENNDPIAAPEINFRFRDKWELLTALLHTGNESNQRKLLLGRGWAAIDQNGDVQTGKWDMFIKRMREQGVLTKRDYDFAQKVWDLFDEHLPIIQQAHKKLLGRYFDTVPSRPFSNEFGEYSGGYVPAKYSTLENEAASLRADKKALEDTPNSFMYPDTGRGMTKNRIENYAAPMDLNIKSLPGAIDDSLRFALIQPAIKDVSKIVMSNRFRDNIAKQNKKIASEMLVPWLQRTAKQQVTLADGSGVAWKGVDRMARWLRSSASLNILALSVGNALQQTTGLFIAAVKVPPRKLLTSMVKYFKDSSGVADFINNKSQFMRTFSGENTIDLQNQIEDLVLNPNKYEITKKFAQRNASILAVFTQNFVNNVAWHAAYEHAVEGGYSDVDAIAIADKAVTRTQGTPFPEDISRIETGTPVMRLFTMFSSYFNMMANLQSSEFATTIKQQGLKKGASRLFYVYAMGFMLPAIGSELITTALSGKGLDEDDDDVYIDDLLSIFFGSQFKAATMMFPVAGQVIQAGVNRYNDKIYDDNIRSSPVISQLDSALSAGYTVPKALFSDGSKKRAIRDGLTLLGTMTQSPVAPIAKPISYLIDVSEGDADPTGPIDFTRGLITGKPGRN